VSTSSRHPALKHRCPVCGAAVGKYCIEIQTTGGRTARTVCLSRIPDPPQPTQVRLIETTGGRTAR